MKEKLTGGLLVVYYLLTLLSAVAFFAVMMSFTQIEWGWPWWVNILAFPFLYMIIRVIPLAETLLALATLIYTVVQLFALHHGKMFPVCAFFTVVSIVRLAFGFFAGLALRE